MIAARLASLTLLALVSIASPPAAAPVAAPAPIVLASLCSDLGPFGLLPPAGGFTAGCGRRFTLKLGASLGPDGNYILLDYPSCASGACAGQTGTTGLACHAIQGYECCVDNAQVVPTMQGSNVGLLVTGINSRISNDTDSRTTICYSEYTGDGRRVLYVPTITTIIGSGVATVTGFAEIFLAAAPTGSGNGTTFLVEVVAPDATPVSPHTWGRVKTLYR